MAVLVEFFHGAPPSALPTMGPSVWPYAQTVTHINGGMSPEIPVILHGPANWAKTQALLDSGADATAIPYGWADLLGVDLENAESVIAWGNGVEAEYLKPRETLRVDIAGTVVDLSPYFAPWDHLVLGRDVFRGYGRVTFDERARTVVLDPYEDGPR